MFRKKYIEVFAAIDPNPRDHHKDKRSIRFETNKPQRTEVKQPSDHVLKELELLKQQLSTTQDHQTLLPGPIQAIITGLRDQDVDQNVLNQLSPYLLEKYYGEQLKSEEQLKGVTKQFFLQRLEHIETDQPKKCVNQNMYIYLGQQEWEKQQRLPN
ncbi:hypothetical protein [Piscibacillus salipiscarius]|uniref:hypothetical protein n=1 Tax=Piscibacillus salipiscarius TaxID=299480 RepID=UPI002436DCA1|nr:hypothetical protein [Piscibacillus salipiscarius]